MIRTLQPTLPDPAHGCKPEENNTRKEMITSLRRTSYDIGACINIAVGHSCSGEILLYCFVNSLTSKYFVCKRKKTHSPKAFFLGGGGREGVFCFLHMATFVGFFLFWFLGTQVKKGAIIAPNTVIYLY